jgi:hypothetical protein
MHPGHAAAVARIKPGGAKIKENGFSHHLQPRGGLTFTRL